MQRALARSAVAVAVGVAQLPELGDAGVPDVARRGQQPGADAVGRVVEAVGEDGRARRPCRRRRVSSTRRTRSCSTLVGRRTPCRGTSGTSPRGRRRSGRPGRRRASSCARGCRSRRVQAERLGDVEAALARRCRRRPGWPASARRRRARPSGPAGTRTVRMALSPSSDAAAIGGCRVCPSLESHALGPGGPETRSDNTSNAAQAWGHGATKAMSCACGDPYYMSAVWAGGKPACWHGGANRDTEDSG